MAEMKLQIEVKDIESVNKLIRVLASHYSDLPSDVQAAVYSLVDEGGIEFSEVPEAPEVASCHPI